MVFCFCKHHTRANMRKEFLLDEHAASGIQDSLGLLDVYADIVYCIDLTSSMAPIINRVKETARCLHFDLQKRMRENYRRNIKQLRIKVIGFRDAYCDGARAFEQSRFFDLPNDTGEFEMFVKSLEAKGGGDIPENSLEALALAMQSDWCKAVDTGIRKRHIIILFTDAPAHEFEQAREGIDRYYPKNMPQSYAELVDWWCGQGSLKNESHVSMGSRTKRLGIFVPKDCYPWGMVEEDFDNCLISYICPDKGGEDISAEGLLKMLSETMV